uniref:Ycf66 n=1 Tax=Phaeophyceae sp. TaxID=2249243 RepID=A0A8E5BEC1_9PHAE|nr:Ycf66 [Phaeophyceae sp.]
MINIFFRANFILGFIIILSGLVLYFLKDVRSELARDEDLFVITLNIVYGLILINHGWRLDPILIFSQIIIISSCITNGWENVRLRGFIAQVVYEYECMELQKICEEIVDK